MTELFEKGHDKKGAVAREPMRETLRHDPNRPLSEYIEDEESDRLRIAKSEFPDGFDLQWVTHSIFGKIESGLRGRFERKGWVPVLTDDFQSQFARFMPDGHKGEVEVDGLVLMARPLSFSKRAKEIEHREAIEKVQIKENQIMGGEMDGVKFDTKHPTALGRISRSYETIAVPDDRPAK